MIKIQKEKFKERCIIHPQYRIEYIKIKETENSKQKQLFYCLNCVRNDDTFEIQDYQMIKQLILNGNDKILSKYPPNTNQDTINKLMKITNSNRSSDEIITKINDIFNKFKNKINQDIDIRHKEMIKIAQELPYKYKDILKEYQNISKINEIKSHLLNNNINLNQKEILCSEIIKELQDNIHLNTNKLFDLLQSHLTHPYFDFEKYKIKEEQIFNSIQNLSLFYNIPKQQKINIDLTPTAWQDGLKNQKITKNNLNQQSVEIIQNGYKSYNTVSNFILNNDIKYVIRLKIDHLSGSRCQIGLMANENISNNEGSHDQLYCSFQKSNQGIIFQNSLFQKGICAYLKGGQLCLSKERELEFRIHIDENIVEILDYPDYKSQIGLAEEDFQLLIQKQQFRMYIGLQNINDKVTLKEAFIVDQFD